MLVRVEFKLFVVIGKKEKRNTSKLLEHVAC